MLFVWSAICVDHLQWTSSCWDERNYSDLWYINLIYKNIHVYNMEEVPELGTL